MKMHHSTGLVLSCLVCCHLLLGGCGQQSAEPIQKRIISQKIQIPAKPATAPAPTAPAMQPPKKSPLASADNTINASEYVTVQKAAISNADMDAAAALIKAAEEEKIDPFQPLFQDQKGKKLTTTISKSNSRIPKTPLETMDISQLKLVAIIQSPSGNKALVEEASGKGYIISVGTYIGLHAGQVRKIEKNRIIIDEPLLAVEEADYNALYNIDGKSFSLRKNSEKVYVNLNGDQSEAVIRSINGQDFFVESKKIELPKPPGEK